MKKLNVQKMVNSHSRITLLFLFIFLQICSTFAQDKTIGTLISKTTMYQQPNTVSKGIGILPVGGKVTVLSSNGKGWAKVSFVANQNGRDVTYTGWITSKNMKTRVVEDMKKYPKIEGLYSSEERSSIGCENISPMYDYDHEFTLNINAVSANYDNVIKLCRAIDGECIRMVYVRRGTSFEINNIPAGGYYLKIASGEDMRKRTDANGNCMIVFAENASFEYESDGVNGNFGTIDSDLFNKEGLRLAHELRKQLPVDVELWYGYAYEDEKNRNSLKILIK